LIRVTEQSAIDGHPANFNYRGISTFNTTRANPSNWRASVSYVTGAHNLKIGYQGAFQADNNTVTPNDQQLAYRFRNGVPNRFTFYLPDWEIGNRTATTSFFVQDSWTRDRLTLQGAVRYDRVVSWSPAEANGTALTSRFNAAPMSFERTDSVNAYHDISPRFGAAYDVFGTGKTAVKFNLGRYLDSATNDSVYTENNPAANVVRSVNRNWQDGNGNFVVDCNILDPPGVAACRPATGRHARSSRGRDPCPRRPGTTPRETCRARSAHQSAGCEGRSRRRCPRPYRESTPESAAPAA
jgi:hypothetical protein